jgi:hypothetical protein
MGFIVPKVRMKVNIKLATAKKEAVEAYFKAFPKMSGETKTNHGLRTNI